MGPRKQEDGSFVFAIGFDADTDIPLIDMEADYGRYVVSAIEKAIGGEVLAEVSTGVYITPAKMVEEFSKSMLSLFIQTPLLH